MPTSWQATASPEVVKGVVSYFRNEVAQDLNPHLKADLLDSFKALIDQDPTIPDSKRESLKVLQGGEVSQPMIIPGKD